MKNLKRVKRERRHKRIRSTVSGTNEKPRISVYRSNKDLFVQVINDKENKTVLSISTKKEKGENKVDKSFSAGENLGKLMLDKKINLAVFDRGGNIYAGRVKSLAEGLRKSGVKI